MPFRIREIQVSQPNRRDSYPSRILVPTGKLGLELYAGYFELKPSKLFADTDYTKLEDKIDDIVPYLKEAIFELKQIHQNKRSTFYQTPQLKVVNGCGIAHQ